LQDSYLRIRSQQKSQQIALDADLQPRLTQTYQQLQQAITHQNQQDIVI